jgi:hypothetical protein
VTVKALFAATATAAALVFSLPANTAQITVGQASVLN